MKPAHIIVLALAAAFATACATVAEEASLPAPSTRENITYAADIKPIFDAACVKCHGGDKAKARLHMDTREGVLKGTNQGKIIVTGDAEKSLLVKSIAHAMKDPEGWMPPLKNKAGIKPLTQDEIALIMGWINQGAK